jgi:hypothetical protein
MVKFNSLQVREYAPFSLTRLDCGALPKPHFVCAYLQFHSFAFLVFARGSPDANFVSIVLKTQIGPQLPKIVVLSIPPLELTARHSERVFSSWELHLGIY